LGVEVEVADAPGSWQGRKAFQAGVASGLGGGDLHGEPAFQERGRAELGGAGVVRVGGQRFGRGGQA
jgi:hypothetical protein